MFGYLNRKHCMSVRFIQRSSVAQIEPTVEALLICNIIHQQYTHGASIICGCDCSESFLAGRVPYLQLHSLAV